MVLLIVDMQKLIVNETLYKFKDFMSNIKLLIDTARTEGIEVIFTRHDDGIGELLSKGNEGFDICDEFQPVNEEKIFDKTVNSPFKESGLLEYLKSKKEHLLIVAGLQTEYCIDATVKCGFEYDFDIIVPEYSNSTFNNEFMSSEESYKYYNKNIWNERYAKCLSLEDTLKIMKNNIDTK